MKNAASKSNFLGKVMDRIGRLDREGLETVVQRLARERSFLDTLFNVIEDGVLVADPAGKIIYFNAAATRLLGCQPESAQGEPVTRFLPDLDWNHLVQFDRKGGQQVIRREFEVFYPRHRFLRLYAAPLDGEVAGSSGLALILHDSTEVRQKTVEAIESERLHSLTLLAASVAHEIGNPLNALHIHLQLMGREVKKLQQAPQAPSPRPAASPVRRRPGLNAAPSSSGSAESAEITGRLDQYLNVCQGEIARLDYIVTQFLQAIRPTPPQVKMGSINDVVTETLTLLRPELDNRGIQIREKLARDLPLAPLDSGQIKQALVNLIKNAMQTMTRGGELTLQTGEGADGAWVSVGDTGGGIPQETINRIFEPFYTTKQKGTGLGLMIVQRIVRDHGGRIELDSRVGEGTTFRLWLPLRERAPRLLEAHLRD